MLNVIITFDAQHQYTLAVKSTAITHLPDQYYIVIFDLGTNVDTTSLMDYVKNNSNMAASIQVLDGNEETESYTDFYFSNLSYLSDRRGNLNLQMSWTNNAQLSV